ncbi:unnamed protein product [Closterium sp. NIES-64]|nr:unnamed protein product [Closterium sp. NIES-64]
MSKSALERAPVDESVLLMKFYQLSLGSARQLLTAAQGELPFEVNEQEALIVHYLGSLFVLGRSGTGKTTIFTHRLLRLERMFLRAMGERGQLGPAVETGSGVSGRGSAVRARVGGEGGRGKAVGEGKGGREEGGEDGEGREARGVGTLRQVIVTLSSRLCAAIRHHVYKVRRTMLEADAILPAGTAPPNTAAGGQEQEQQQGETGEVEELLLSEEAEEKLVGDLPESLDEVQPDAYPLVLTFKKLLNMVNATLARPFQPDGVKAGGGWHGKTATGGGWKRGEYRAQGAGEKGGNGSDVDGSEYFSQDGDDEDEEEEEEDEDEEDEWGPSYHQSHWHRDRAQGTRGASSNNAGYSTTGVLSLPEEVDYDRFESLYWPHFNTSVTRKFDALLVYKEFFSHIKGSLHALRSPRGRLSQEAYVALSHTRTSSFDEAQREVIYGLYSQYERMKRQRRDHDLCDYVYHVHRELARGATRICTPASLAAAAATTGTAANAAAMGAASRATNRSVASRGGGGGGDDKVRCGPPFQYVYVDEVQDLTQAQIAILCFLCANTSDGFVFAGDTAQTIARGVDFRFQDIRRLFYELFLGRKVDVVGDAGSEGVEGGGGGGASSGGAAGGAGERESGTEEGRGREKQGRWAGAAAARGKHKVSGKGRRMLEEVGSGAAAASAATLTVVRLADSVVRVLLHFFPHAVDRLAPEFSLIDGEAPVFLDAMEGDDIVTQLFGKKGAIGGGGCEFGAEKVILVRDAESCTELVKRIGSKGLVLSVHECKGLEFHDALVYNFFSGSPMASSWRLLYHYMRDHSLIPSAEDGSGRWQCPSFDPKRHNLLCSELKQLYVVLTRARQRLWIYEEDEGARRPGHGPLFNAAQFEAAVLSFERAGDEHSAAVARAALLQQTAKRLQGTDPKKASKMFQDAADAFLKVDKPRDAARCLISAGKMKQAGDVYRDRCVPPMWVKSGECYELAAMAEEAAQCFAQLPSLAKKRQFLERRDFFGELLQIEITEGNFQRAAEMMLKKGDMVGAARMFLGQKEWGPAFECAMGAARVVSMWANQNKGWPLNVRERKQEKVEKQEVIAETRKAKLPLGLGKEDEGKRVKVKAENGEAVPNAWEARADADESETEVQGKIDAPEGGGKQQKAETQEKAEKQEGVERNVGENIDATMDALETAVALWVWERKDREQGKDVKDLEEGSSVGLGIQGLGGVSGREGGEVDEREGLEAFTLLWLRDFHALASATGRGRQVDSGGEEMDKWWQLLIRCRADELLGMVGAMGKGALGGESAGQAGVVPEEGEEEEEDLGLGERSLAAEVLVSWKGLLLSIQRAKASLSHHASTSLPRSSATPSAPILPSPAKPAANQPSRPSPGAAAAVVTLRPEWQAVNQGAPQQLQQQEQAQKQKHQEELPFEVEWREVKVWWGRWSERVAAMSFLVGLSSAHWLNPVQAAVSHLPDQGTRGEVAREAAARAGAIYWARQASEMVKECAAVMQQAMRSLEKGLLGRRERGAAGDKKRARELHLQLELWVEIHALLQFAIDLCGGGRQEQNLQQGEEQSSQVQGAGRVENLIWWPIRSGVAPAERGSLFLRLLVLVAVSVCNVDRHHGHEFFSYLVDHLLILFSPLDRLPNPLISTLPPKLYYDLKNMFRRDKPAPGYRVPLLGGNTENAADAVAAAAVDEEEDGGAGDGTVGEEGAGAESGAGADSDSTTEAAVAPQSGESLEQGDEWGGDEEGKAGTVGGAGKHVGKELKNAQLQTDEREEVDGVKIALRITQQLRSCLHQVDMDAFLALIQEGVRQLKQLLQQGGSGTGQGQQERKGQGRGWSEEEAEKHEQLLEEALDAEESLAAATSAVHHSHAGHASASVSWLHSTAIGPLSNLLSQHKALEHRLKQLLHSTEKEGASAQGGSGKGSGRVKQEGSSGVQEPGGGKGKGKKGAGRSGGKDGGKGGKKQRGGRSRRRY